MRYRKFLDLLQEGQLDGFIVSKPSNLEYLFGFNGSAGLACCIGGDSFLIVDGRYTDQASSQSRHCRVVPAPESLHKTLRETLQQCLAGASSTSAIGLETAFVSHDFFKLVESWGLRVDWRAAGDPVGNLRSVKDPQEIEILRAAFARSQSALQQALEIIRPGMGEIEIAGRLELELRLQGAEFFSFETIAVCGPRTALPHGRPGSELWQREDPLLLDFGLRWKGFCSDLTRMLLPASGKSRELAAIVDEARQKAFGQVRPGRKASEIDAAARKIIAQRGYGPRFSHSLGHGVGLDIHELPRIGPQSEQVLQAGMVFTIEPGIYLPGECGVRLEDAVVVTEGGCEYLSDPSK